jgi:aldose 1-epimerase
VLALSGCYPLVPYSNRLGYRRFRWLGRTTPPQPNFDDSPHSVHGVAWQRPWRWQSQREHTTPSCAAARGPDATGPSPSTARQRFVLTPDGAGTCTWPSPTPRAPQPVGLGWHPYFPKRARSRLHIELTDRWDSDASGLPTRKVPQPGIDADVAHLAFDHCFEGWRARRASATRSCRCKLTSSLPYLVVFTPETKDYYCVEPVSHVSNAIHMADPAAHGLRTLAPGATFRRLDEAGDRAA